MSDLNDTITPDCNKTFKSKPVEQDQWKDKPVKSNYIKKRINKQVKHIFAVLEDKHDKSSFDTVEKTILPLVFALGRLFLAYFFAWRNEHFSKHQSKDILKNCYKKGTPQSRTLGTYFGKVRYWRDYFRHKKGGGGVYALDIDLKLTTDKFSTLVIGHAARLATLVSFDRVTELLKSFLLWSPSKTTVEKSVLGLGRFTHQWFQTAPAPEGDGEVLIIQIDSKATPTATESELDKRRGKRQTNAYNGSARHRGREKRKQQGKKPRRKKGDKSKNGKAATLVVMYTLKRGVDNEGNPILEGPLNKKVHASYACKRCAFAFARREADKRGFSEESGEVVQIITDGDNNFETYVNEYFPSAIHTLDIMHAMEYVWKAGRCLFQEGSKELAKWAERMQELLYGGKAKQVVSELKEHLGEIPKQGPGNKAKRSGIECAISYLEKRIHLMNYDTAIAQDLEIATGAVEGAVNHVIATRFDKGGMRWIKERSEALLQLRCIELNGDWEEFMSFVQDMIFKRSVEEHRSQTLLTKQESPIPEIADYA